MKGDAYTLDRFIEEMRRITRDAGTERDVIAAMRPLVRRLALSETWLEPRFYHADSEQGFGACLLHEEPDHSLAVFVASWLPGRGAPPHDHGTWAIVAGVDGPERNVFFERTDNRARPGYAELRPIGEQVFGPGEVLAMPAGTIHSVRNDSDRITLSLHVYGKHINHTQRSQFDPDQRIEKPFIVKHD
ncbi:MAG TPA: cysteine dioxygenase family protein [Burkholderiaceae bacterium]|nr:cysteine dioxygenase family protein [Burkholderiaceae bacterium]